MNASLLAILIFGLFMALYAIILYNLLVRKRNQVDYAFGGMDVQLKKRFDLIPNIVDTLRQYMTHEKELLTSITEIRAAVNRGQTGAEEKLDLDQQLSLGIKSLMLAVENYPDLKASDNFINLQRTLNEVESQISAARRSYNAAITDYNNAIQTFPGNLMAGAMGLKLMRVFEISQTERQNPNIKKLFS